MRTLRRRSSSTLSGASAFWLLLMALALMVSLLVAKPAHAKTFTVNSTQDGEDFDPGDGICDASASAFRNPCTLRAAIQETEANDNAPTVDTIDFDIPNDPNIPGDEVRTIKPTKSLPTINEPTILNGYSQPGASPNTLAQGNDMVLKIELDGTNAGSLPQTDGLELGPASSNSVVKGLVINRFAANGVFINGDGSKVQGNLIGTDPTGTLDRGNGGNGVHASYSTSNNQIGGTTPEARNVISGNDSYGVRLFGSEHTVLGNYIGTNKNGTGDLGNSLDGVDIRSFKCTVGNNTAAGANTIAFNDNDGVGVYVCGGCDDLPENNSILRNSIFENGDDVANDLGIDLYNNGFTANDLKDPDTGPNNLQNKPVISSATTSGSTTTIKGSLNSTPEKTFTLRLFSNPQGPALATEGKNYIGTKSVTTNANGNTGTFTFTPNQAVPVGGLITATATDEPGGNTSEFSFAKQVS